VATEAREMSGYRGSQAGGQPGWAWRPQSGLNHAHILYTPQLVFPTFSLHLSPRNCKLRATGPGDLLVGGGVLKYLSLRFFFLGQLHDDGFVLACQLGAAGANTKAAEVRWSSPGCACQQIRERTKPWG